MILRGVGDMTSGTIYFAVLGISYIIIGLFAFFFTKYPHRETTLKKLERKYGVIDEKRLCKFEGLNYFVSGGILLIISIIIKSIKHIPSFWIILFVLLFLFLAAAYYPLRKKYLGIK